MAHGEADYTKTTAAKAVYAKIDFDLPVILVDRFDSANFLWRPAGVPVDYDALLETGAAYEGDAGMALRTSLAAGGAGQFVTVTRRAFTTPTRKLSFSALFRINSTAAQTRLLRFRIHGLYNNLQYSAAFQYRPVDAAWDYLNNAAGYTPIITGITQELLGWHRVYFEIDLENMQYIAFETADRRINMQGTPIWTAAPPASEDLIIVLYLYNELIGTRADVSIDDVIVKELG